MTLATAGFRPQAAVANGRPASVPSATHGPTPPRRTDAQMIVIITMAEIGNHARNESWPSLDVASWLFDRANFVLIASLVFGVLATGVIVWMGIVKEHHWDVLRDQSNEKVAGLELEAAKAKEEAAKAIESAAKANERTAAAEIRLEEMRQKIGPRRIDEELFLSRLVGVPKKPVVVSHAPDDPDSYFLAIRLLSVLGRANWDAQYVGTTPEMLRCVGQV
jgi:hypothetical protein